MPTTPANLDKLKQAAAILKAVIRADESNDTTYDNDYDPTPALRAAVTLIEAVKFSIDQDEDRCFRANGRFPTRDDSSPLIEAYCIIKACIAMEDTGADWGLTWAMLPAVRLIDEVITRRKPPSARAKRTHDGNVVSLSGGAVNT
jgi:hypothetical protein